MRASTLDGVKIKAKVVKWCRADNLEPDPEETTDKHCGWSLVRDLIEMQGASAGV
jgi:hypothetical protein